jgi:hypothetical protein
VASSAVNVQRHPAVPVNWLELDIDVAGAPASEQSDVVNSRSELRSILPESNRARKTDALS